MKTISEDIFNTHWVKRPEYEDPYTFDKWINIYSAHIPGHIEQIRNNVAVWKSRK